MLLNDDGTGFSLIVRDDGKGFDASRGCAGGPGTSAWRAMRERIEMTGGRLKLESRPGAGTVLQVWLPELEHGERAGALVSTRTRVLVAEDHPMFRHALMEAVKSRPDLELVGTAENGRVAIEEIRRLEPEVALVDMRMPELDGAQVLNAVVRDKIPTRVLFLSTHTESAKIYDLLARGAVRIPRQDLLGGGGLQRDRGRRAGKTVLSQSIEGDVLQQIRIRAEDTGTKLTAREQEVLRLVADGHSGPDIAEQLYIEASTVKTHLQHVYEKLGVSERAAAVAEAMRRGLLE